MNISRLSRARLSVLAPAALLLALTACKDHGHRTTSESPASADSPAAASVHHDSAVQGGKCGAQVADGKIPVLTNEKLSARTHELCFSGFTLLESGITHTPLWVAERLTRERVEAARGLPRNNAFHAEDQLPEEDRSELSDYVRSGYDRGHMSPSGDQDSADSQYESFSLSNMIPQDPNNNQNLWEGIESSTRALAAERGSLYVVTGPLFEGASLQRLNGRVFVPTSVYKAVYDPQRQQAAAYVTPNAPGMDYQVVSIAELEKRAGIDLFPDMPASVKEHAAELPAPTPHGHGGHGRGHYGAPGSDGGYRSHGHRRHY